MKTEPIVFRDDITIKVDGGGCAFTLSERDHKGVQCVVIRRENGADLHSLRTGEHSRRKGL